MGLCEIDDVDVVADAAAIRCRVVGAVDLDRLLLAECNLEDIRDEVGLDAVILAELLGGTRRIEVTECDEGDPMELSVPAEYLLEHQLRLAVGVDWLLRRNFVNGHRLGDAEGGAGGGEDEALHSLGDHGLQQVHAIRHVVAEIFPGIGHRFPDQRIGGEVHDGLGF